MASDVMTLFNMPTQQQLGQRYLESQMTSPAQMGNQGLLQQVASLGGNAGAVAGYAGGRLFGGATPEQIRAKGIEEAMMKVQGMGLTSDAEMYSALSKELAARGLTQDAFMANKEARTAMREEQVLKKGGFDIEKAQVDLQKAKEDMLTLEEQIAVAMSQGEESKVVGLQRQLAAKKQAAAAVQAEIDYKTKAGNAAIMNAEANRERAARDAAGEKYTQAIYDEGIVPGTKGATPLGYRNAVTGKIRDVSTNEVYDNLDQLKQARMLRGQSAKPNAPTTPNAPAKKQPLGTISDFYN
jgi:hypothetical protein